MIPYSIYCLLTHFVPCSNGQGWQYYASLAAASGQLGWQIGTADLSSGADCSRKYENMDFLFTLSQSKM